MPDLRMSAELATRHADRAKFAVLLLLGAGIAQAWPMKIAAHYYKRSRLRLAEPGYFCPAAFYRAINRAFYGEPPGCLPRLREIRRSPRLRRATEPGHGTRKPSLFRGTESRAASHVVDWGSGNRIPHRMR